MTKSTVDVDLVERAQRLAADKGRLAGAVLRSVKSKIDPGYMALKKSASEILMATQRYVILQKHADGTGYGADVAANAKAKLEQLVG